MFNRTMKLKYMGKLMVKSLFYKIGLLISTMTSVIEVICGTSYNNSYAYCPIEDELC